MRVDPNAPELTLDKVHQEQDAFLVCHRIIERPEDVLRIVLA
ncbi:MAG TPA: hypothetical protein VJ698_22145 [Noviherbaspirillum sp.]|nr:hypothetical protein [Noviherbaspirillum sp.]HJV88187.1 hypothetical protein [Noviherbaspirillum sp.]